MKNIKSIKWQDIHTLVFDFDGVFTDNKVYTKLSELKKVTA